MNDANKIAGRSSTDYKSMNRFVLSSHLKTELTKPPRQASNLLDSFLHSKWINWLKHYTKSRFGPRHKFVSYRSGSENGVFSMDQLSKEKTVTIALLSDWGTDTVESMNIGKAVHTHAPDYSIHMGDTYYVGTHDELRQNFDPNNSCWPYGSVGSFALPGNHEMYSNGDPYYHTLLPWMGLKLPFRRDQQASYICLENEYWTIIGLDTGYRSVSFPFLEVVTSKADLRPEVMDWLQNELKIKDLKKGIIILTHHQNVSSFSKSYRRAGKQLNSLIGPDRKVLWFWGHEHRFAMYGRNGDKDGIAAFGRCIGNGGMPSDCAEKPNKERAETDKLVLYDNRCRTTIGKLDIGHNGYALLKLSNENLQVEYYDEKSLLVTERWMYDSTINEIIGKSIVINNNKLSMVNNANMAIQ